MSRKYALVVSSVVAHGVAVVALIIAGWWNIEKLDHETERVATLWRAAPQRPMPGGGDGKLPPLRPKSKGSDGAKQNARKAVHDVQPAPLLEVAPDTVGDDGGDEDGDPDGNKWGHKYGDKNGTGKGLFIGSDSNCRMPECGTAIPTVEIDDTDPDEEKVVRPEVMSALRKSKAHIVPPDSVKREMVRNGETETEAAFKICLDTTGRVSSVTFIGKTGYDAYDAKLMREIRKWEYRAFSIDGKAVPICAMTRLIYRMK